jgi:hypothetical protein
MIRERFQRRTLAAMEAALESACKRWPNGGTHKLRKKVAQRIILCADAGNTSPDALSEAAERTLTPSPRNESSRNARPASRTVMPHHERPESAGPSQWHR